MTSFDGFDMVAPYLIDLTSVEPTEATKQGAFGVKLDCCSEGEAVAAKSPEVTVTGCPCFTADLELVGSIVTTVRMALGGVLMLRDRDTVPDGFSHVQWRSIP